MEKVVLWEWLNYVTGLVLLNYGIDFVMEAGQAGSRGSRCLVYVPDLVLFNSLGTRSEVGRRVGGWTAGVGPSIPGSGLYFGH